MNYKLAKQLKDAGFPQGISDDGFVIRMNGVHEQRVFAYYAKDFIDAIRCPTLEELIATCGNDFSELWRSQRTPSLWRAEGIANYIGDGATPQDATANLWLALNKK